MLIDGWGRFIAKKILIVEDYEDSRMFLKLLLEAFGYTVLEASDGYEAVEKVKDQFPDLILMDMAMPVMDGLTATRIIRKLDDGAEIPIIALTASTNSFYTSAIDVGCNEVVKKPFDPDKLHSLLNHYLESSHL